MAKRTRSDIIHMVSASVPEVGKAQVANIIKTTLAYIALEVRGGNSVELKGFATFKPVDRNAKIGRNMTTGEPIHIPAHRACAVKAKFKMDV